jgi:hypothetical protein
MKESSASGHHRCTSGKLRLFWRKMIEEPQWEILTERLKKFLAYPPAGKQEPAANIPKAE